MSKTLLERERLGQQIGGAFTGHTPTAGLVESTAGGTGSLDAIGDSPGQAAKLVRVRGERSVMRVRAASSRCIDVRFVTPERRPDPEIRAGRFRADLYYRISGLVVRIPRCVSR